MGFLSNLFGGDEDEIPEKDAEKLLNENKEILARYGVLKARLGARDANMTKASRDKDIFERMAKEGRG